MRKRIEIFLVCMILVTSFTTAVFSVENVKGSRITIYVHPGESIQDAIDIANPGDTIFVKNGTYNENVIIKKSINLIGENKSSTIIRGIGFSDVISIETDFINISYFTIENSGDFYNSFDSAIQFNSKFCMISNNIINDNLMGVVCYTDSSNNRVINNSFSMNSWVGIYLKSSKNNIISGNTFYGRGIFVQNSYNNSIVDNIVNNKSLIYLEDQSDLTIDDQAGQIILVSCDFITIQNQSLSDSNDGIVLLDSNNCIIKNNIIFNNDDGIEFLSSSLNEICGNIFKSNFRWGILLTDGSNDNRIFRNTFENNGKGSPFWPGYGIYLDYCRRNYVIENNFIKNNEHASFNNSFNNIWFHNFWDDHAGGFLRSKFIIGVGILRFNIDIFPSKYEHDIKYMS